LGSKQDFLNIATSDTALIEDLAPNAKSLEGYLFPNTYEFTRTQTMQEMVAMMVKQFRQVAREIGLSADSQAAAIENVAQTNPVRTNDIRKIVTMASIIERETGNPEERPLVASVYYNRLAKNIALGADPCVIYAELLQGTYAGALHHADMQYNSAYNTYTHVGLPPGPIGNPGKTSLAAALHPVSTNYYYFVADGNGHHRFASTLEEHNRNVAAYRRAMAGK
jgi:UPF0755 protein